MSDTTKYFHVKVSFEKGQACRATIGSRSVLADYIATDGELGHLVVIFDRQSNKDVEVFASHVAKVGKVKNG